MDKIKLLLKSCNFITVIDIKLKNITKDDVENFCNEFGLTWSVENRVGGIVFYKDNELVTSFKNYF